MANEKMIKEMQEEAYNKGLEDGRNEVWEFIKKTDMAKSPSDAMEMLDAFGVKSYRDIFRNFTPQEALAKLEAYEMSQKIEVGDVFIDTHTGIPCVLSKIVWEDEERPYIVTFSDGSGSSRSKKTFLEDYKKTGKHIDITSILEQISEV